MKHAFSIEMTSPSHVRSINFSVNNRDRVLFEGSLGELQRLGIVDSVMLEIVGANGVLRIDLTEKELYRHLFMNTLKNNT
ncbi:MAG: hypothetical protein ACXAEX_04640 [Promethearchaeota archaeon]